MIPLRRDEPETEAWRDWRTEAERRSDDLKAAWERWLSDAHDAGVPPAQYRKEHPPPKIDDAFYKKRADVVKEWSGGRCAYCEAPTVETAQTGDVEHYRPKGVATSADGAAVEGHYGYYWLAYSWSNLMGACILCNRPTTAPDERSRGKWNKFPIENEAVRAASGNDDIKAEHPMILDPFDPEFRTEDHFSFDDSGVIAGITEEARTTIDILDLNRKGLQEGRRNERELVRSALANVNLEAGRLVDAICRLQRVEAGREAYCGAARALLAEALSDNPLKRQLLDAALACDVQCPE